MEHYAEIELPADAGAPVDVERVLREQRGYVRNDADLGPCARCAALVPAPMTSTLWSPHPHFGGGEVAVLSLNRMPVVPGAAKNCVRVRPAQHIRFGAPQWEVVAAVRHAGADVSTGHYYAFVRCGDGAYRVVDDSFVGPEISFPQAWAQIEWQPTMLFCVRVRNDSPEAADSGVARDAAPQPARPAPPSAAASCDAAPPPQKKRRVDDVEILSATPESDPPSPECSQQFGDGAGCGSALIWPTTRRAL